MLKRLWRAWEAQLQEAEGAREGLEEKVNTLEELLTLKKQLERSSEICSGIDGNC